MASFPGVLLGSSPVPTSASGAISFSSLGLASTTSACEWIVQIEEACTITHVGFAPTARTGTPPTYICGLQGVTSGIPDGTFKGGGTPASKTFTPPASTAWNNTWQWQQLANSYAASRGELLAIVINYSSGTADASNNLSFKTDANGFEGREGFPYAIQNTAGSRARSGQLPWFGYKSSTRSYWTPFYGTVATAYSSASSPNEYALAFTLPAGLCSHYRVIGARFRWTTPAAAKNFSVKLYEGTTVRQTTGTWSSDNIRTNAQDSNSGRFYFTDTDLWPLVPGTTYYLALLAESTSMNMALVSAGANDAQDAAVNGNGAFYLATRAGGAWTPDTFQRPLVDLILGAVTAETLFIPVE